MQQSLRFKLNGNLIETEEGAETPVLDWLRNGAGLKGTKEGCREGDCGACLALLGQHRSGGEGIEWLPVATCLLALGELDGRHLVTIEGLAQAGPSPVMLALHGENASQCGFCSPGIVVALTGFLIGPGPHDASRALASIEGNLCRCTGYASIARAARSLAADYENAPRESGARIAALAARGVLPAPLAASMGELPEPASIGRGDAAAKPEAFPRLGGGTDWYVRNPEPDPDLEPDFVDRAAGLRSIYREGEGHEARLLVGAAASIRDFFADPGVRALAAGIEAFEASIASPHIRARATLAGNIANASPVADMTAMLLALGAELRLLRPKGERLVALDRFFTGYKTMDLKSDERIEAMALPAAAPLRFSFEKAAKRERLDIAAVNTALALRLDSSGIMRQVRLSAGGVGPTPLLLREVAAALEGQAPSARAFRQAAEAARASVSPISDVRGSADYRRRVLGRLILGHGLRLFPDALDLEELLA